MKVHQTDTQVKNINFTLPKRPGSELCAPESAFTASGLTESHAGPGVCGEPCSVPAGQGTWTAVCEGSRQQGPLGNPANTPAQA